MPPLAPRDEYHVCHVERQHGLVRSFLTDTCYLSLEACESLWKISVGELLMAGERDRAIASCMDDDTRTTLRAKCRIIQAHGERHLPELLARTAEWCRTHDVKHDIYGRGEMIQRFEAEVAERLGFEAGRFMPTGTLAQQVALRVWCQRAGHDHVGMHPTSHVELHEEQGLAHLHRLRTTLVGPADTPLLAEHLSAVPERLAALLVELPIREVGGKLPSRAELDALIGEAKRRSIPLHLDGARLWECQPFYGEPYDAICRGFSSCYVSFYKGIGALPGAMLLGPADFIAEATIWQRRSGGNPYTLTPQAASAAMQLDERLAHMRGYRERALSFASTLSAIDGISIIPDPPHINLVHVVLALDARAAKKARDRVAERTRLWLFEAAKPCDVPGHCRLEVYVGDALMGLTDEAVGEAFSELMA